MDRKKLIDSSLFPSAQILEAVSVKIECLDNDNKVLNKGTGTLFCNENSYYVITAAHCIQYGESTNSFDKNKINISLPHFGYNYIEISEILYYNLDEKVDFALLAVKFNIDYITIDFDYENGIRFLGRDDFSSNTCIYGYTNTEPNGRLFKARMVSSDTYAIDEHISSSGIEFSNVMQGSSGAGLFVEYNNCIYCLGYVKSRMQGAEKLDDIKIRRIPDINDRVGGDVWIPSLMNNSPDRQTSVRRVGVEKEYNDKWIELREKISNNEEAIELLNDIKTLRTKIISVKSVGNQENVINFILRKRENWNLSEQRAFIYALLDRGLWSNLFGDLPLSGDLNEIPETKKMLIRASTFTQDSQEEDSDLDNSSDEGCYELILREAYKFEFDKMYELVRAWEPKGFWTIKKAFFINLFEDKKDYLRQIKDFIEGENSANERFVAAFIYNILCREFPQPYKYDRFWSEGIENPSDIIAYIASRIDKGKIQPKIFGVHFTQILGGEDITSFPESLRLLQYIVNAGLTTKFGFYLIVNVEYWMKVFRHLVYFIPYPVVYYTLFYGEEKISRWAGQMIAYSNDENMNKLRPGLIKSLLKALRMEHLPSCLMQGIFFMTQELYTSVNEDEWYEEFMSTVFELFVTKIDVSKIGTSDAIFKNVTAAILCIKKADRKKDIFLRLSTIMNKNVRLVSDLICKALWVDKDFVKDKDVIDCILCFISEYPISQIYDILCEFNEVNAFTDEQKKIIDKKIVDEELTFAKRDYPALINLSHLAISPDSINKIKTIILGSDIWNCGISDSSFTEPYPYHIEMLNENVSWTEEELDLIQTNMSKNLELIETHRDKGDPSNFFNNSYINLLTGMKLFMIRLQTKDRINIKEMLKRVDKDINELSGFDNLIEALSSKYYNKVSAALNRLSIALKTDAFENHLSEFIIILSKVALKQSADLDNCITFIAFLMKEYPSKMKSNFSDLLLCILQNFKDYDFEEMNFRVPIINHRFSFIAHQMKPEYKDNTFVIYWTSEQVLNRFGGLDNIM
jgi:hypothetical protein